MENLINALNQNDLLIFAQKADPTKQSVSAIDVDGTRYFLTRVRTVFVDAKGNQTERFMWAKGNAMRPVAPVQPAPVQQTLAQ